MSRTTLHSRYNFKPIAESVSVRDGLIMAIRQSQWSIVDKIRRRKAESISYIRIFQTEDKEDWEMESQAERSARHNRYATIAAERVPKSLEHVENSIEFLPRFRRRFEGEDRIPRFRRKAVRTRKRRATGIWRTMRTRSRRGAIRFLDPQKNTS